MNELIFLKLGGSLITDKNTAHSARLDVITRIAKELAAVLQKKPGMKLLIGHGSGSFGHTAAHKYNTREGVQTPGEWRGFAEVGHQAKTLNSIVLDALVRAGLPVITFAPCSQVLTRSHQVINWDVTQIKLSLENRLIPVIYGDVVFDEQLGGTILSTEEQFEYLAGILHPSRILLAGIELGIWKDFPARSDYFSHITPVTIDRVAVHLAASESPDVTGGMRSKVYSMLKLIESGSCQEVCIFSGLENGSIANALYGKCTGTRISLD